MEIKRELLRLNGLHPSLLDELEDTYVNDNYTIRLWKSKTMDGWHASIINNYGQEPKFDEKDMFSESATKIFSGHISSMKELNAALVACDYPKFKTTEP